MSHTDPKDNKILKLEKENERIKKQLTKFAKDRYGLFWFDVPEGFENDVENKLPILEEVPKLAIRSKDDEPTHILIEGDNYHVLTCLNYTHKGKIDVIYIDPPYNTGSDGFRYKDKRILDKYPDGTEVPKDNPLRHSYWLSFMKKRLELAQTILKDEGVIFISVDDNEAAQLKLLCDEIFRPENFIAQVVWRKKYGGGKGSNFFVDLHEYILCYGKNKTSLNGFKLSRTDEQKEIFELKDEFYKERGGYYIRPLKSGLALRKTLIYPIKCPDGNKINTQWICAEKTYKQLLIEGRIVFKKLKNGKYNVYKKFYEKDNGGTAMPESIFYDIAYNQNGKEELKEIFGVSEGREIPFENPKPTTLIGYLIKLTNKPKDIIILDFFAGSGTTGQAVMELNEEDEGKRQFILITNNEEVVNGEKHKIMTDICLPRIKNVIKGYNNKKALGNSIKYYKTAFVGKNNILNADDKDKIELAHNAGAMLAIAENTLEEVEKNSYYQLFENGKQYTAVYFREEFDKFDSYIKKVRSLKKPVIVYIFSWEKELDFNDFEDDKNITVKTIPQPILEIYKQIYNLA